MKAVILLGMLFAGAAVACNSGDDLDDVGGQAPDRPAVINTVAPTPTPAPSMLRNLRETTTGLSASSGGVKVTVSRVAVADFKEYYAASDERGKRALDTFSTETQDAVTIGQIELSVENTTAGKISIYPTQGTIVVGNEQVKAALFLSSNDVSGDFFPGVIKEGRVYFFLKRTPVANVTDVTYVIGAPFGESFRSLGADIQMKFTLAPR